MGVLGDCRGFQERRPWKGTVRWTNRQTGEETGSIGYRFRPDRGRWDGRLELIYTITRPGRPGRDDTTRQLRYPVGLDTTEPHFGGERWWFRCPLVRDGEPCRRRCFKLYLPPRADYFGCRECYNLTYRSAQEAHRFDSLYAAIAGEMDVPFELVKDCFA
jgi:hypothetical protein